MPVTFLGRRADVSFPDCTLDPTVCRQGYRCFADLHYCASPCTSAADMGRCQLQGYARCDVARGHCAF